MANVYQKLFDTAAQKEGMSKDMYLLAKSIFTQESGAGSNTKTSHANAKGGMQIIPSTFDSVADKGWNIKDPEQNLRAGMRYLKQLNKEAGGDMRLTAVGYYGGSGGMQAAKRGVPRFDKKNPNAPSTFKYANDVVARMGSFGYEDTGKPLPSVVNPAGKTEVAKTFKPSPTDVPTSVAQNAPAPLVEQPAQTQASVLFPSAPDYQTYVSPDVAQAQPQATQGEPAPDPWQSFVAQLGASTPTQQTPAPTATQGVGTNFMDALAYLGATNPALPQAFQSFASWGT